MSLTRVLPMVCPTRSMTHLRKPSMTTDSPTRAAMAVKRYHRVKMKVAKGRDVEYVRAVRERFPDLPLMVDANGSVPVINRHTNVALRVGMPPRSLSKDSASRSATQNAQDAFCD